MQPYPFYPLEDSLLGQILSEIYSEKGNLHSIQSVFQKYLQEGQTSFYFTPRTDKSTDLTVLPPVFRKLYAEEKIDEMRQKFLDLLHPSIGQVRMDVVLEVLEWILTGLASPQVSEQLLKVLLDDESVDSSLLSKILEKYEKMVTSEK